MKRTLLRQVMRLRHIAMLLVFVLTTAYANAALESDDINTAILVDGSIPVKWTNDPTNPWVLSGDESYITTPNNQDSFTTTLSMEYTSSYPVLLTFDYQAHKYRGGGIYHLSYRRRRN